MAKVKTPKQVMRFGYLCDECPEGTRIRIKPTWATKEPRDKDMVRHTKKTGHKSFNRFVIENVK